MQQSYPNPSKSHLCKVAMGKRDEEHQRIRSVRHNCVCLFFISLLPAYLGYKIHITIKSECNTTVK